MKNRFRIFRAKLRLAFVGVGFLLLAGMGFIVQSCASKKTTAQATEPAVEETKKPKPEPTKYGVIPVEPEEPLPVAKYGVPPNFEKRK